MVEATEDQHQAYRPRMTCLSWIMIQPGLREGRPPVLAKHGERIDYGVEDCPPSLRLVSVVGEEYAHGIHWPVPSAASGDRC